MKIYSLILTTYIVTGCADGNFSSSGGGGSKKKSETGSDQGPTSEGDVKNQPGGTQAPNPDPSGLMDGGGRIDVITGVQANKFGVNYDTGLAKRDYDFNDAVLCFTADVTVGSAGQVQSRSDQTVNIALSNRSGCSYVMELQVRDDKG